MHDSVLSPPPTASRRGQMWRTAFGRMAIVAILAIVAAACAPAPATEARPAPAPAPTIDERPSSTSTVAHRVNAGGSSVPGSPTWLADTSSRPAPTLVGGGEGTYSSSTATDMSDPSIPSGTPAALFRTERFDTSKRPQMKWSFPTTPGRYEVRLYFAENYGPHAAAGSRVFDVVVNGRTVLAEYDIFADAGALHTGVMHSTVVDADSSITVEFLARVQNPLVNAIEILHADGTPVPPESPTTTQPTTPTTTPTTTVAPTTTTIAPTTTTTPPAPGDATALKHSPPTLSNPTVVNVTNSNRSLKLDDSRDYVIDMPDTPLTAKGGLVISGGRNVVLIGGHIHFDEWFGGHPYDNRALYLKNQVGTIHIEGLHVTGKVHEGIDLSQGAGAVVQLQNIRMDKVVGTQAGHHADIVQTWQGPRVLRIHRLTGATGYQGIFLRPNDSNVGYTAPTEEVSIEQVQVIQSPEAGYAFWKGVDAGIDYPLHSKDNWITDPRSGDWNQILWPKNSNVWGDVSIGTPPGGDIVTAGDVGADYVSPGYR